MRGVLSAARSWLGVEENEGGVVAIGAALLFVVGWVDVSVQNVAETLFLKRVGVAYLPHVFLASSLLMVATTWLVGRNNASADRARTFPRLLAGMAVGIGVLWLLTRAEVPGIFTTLMFASIQIKAVILIVFWITMGDLVDGRQAKRLFPLMLAGLTAGAVAGSFTSEWIGMAFGIEAPLAFSALVLGLGAVGGVRASASEKGRLSRRLTASTTPRFGEEDSESGGDDSIASLWRRSGLFRMLAVSSACAGVLAPMLYFQFAYTADLATAEAGGEHALLAVYARLRGGINLAILLTQLTAASRLYAAIGVPTSMAATPLAYLVAFVGLGVQLNLTVGVAGLALTRLQTKAFEDPALRVLGNLFPNDVRARAAALIEGPIPRAGGVLGNVITMAAFSAGSAAWVGYAALPIAVAWFAAALLLRRRYPSLLLETLGRQRTSADSDEVHALFDGTTVAALDEALGSHDAARCRAAIAVLGDAKPSVAAPILLDAAAAPAAPMRAVLLAALDEALARQTEALAGHRSAGAKIAQLLEASDLTADERVVAIRTLGLVADGTDTTALLDAQASVSEDEALRLATAVARARAGEAGAGGAAAASSLNQALERAAASGCERTRDALARELALLLAAGPVDDHWRERLSIAASLLTNSSSRRGAAAAIAAAAERFGEDAVAADEALAPLSHDADAPTRAAVMRFFGYARRAEHAQCLLDGVGSGIPEVEQAAREGLVLLGADALESMLVERWFGRRGHREAVLSVVRELPLDVETLRRVYRRALDTARDSIAVERALSGTDAHPLIGQRLRERADEALHAAVLALAAIRDENPFDELDALMTHRRTPRQSAILIEAVEASVDASERAEIVALLECRGADCKGPLGDTGIVVPDAEQARARVLEDPDPLVRAVATATLTPETCTPEDARAVRIATLLRDVPIFEGLSSRQLFNLAAQARLEDAEEGAVVMRENEPGDSLMVVVEGSVEVTRNGRALAEFGPGSFVGEMAVLENAPRSASVRTLSPVRSIQLFRSDLMTLFQEMPAIAISVCEALSVRLRRLNESVDAT